MGLDTTHNCFHGPYGAFNRWRDAVARAAGYQFKRFDGEYRDAVDLDWDVFDLKNYQGEWDIVPGDDPLLYLIVHSDCDGVMHPEQGRHLVARLRQLAPKVDPEGVIYGVRGNSMYEVTLRFADGLEWAAAAGEDVEFH